MAAHVAIKFLLNAILAWVMATELGTYIAVTGGFPAYVILGALLTILNLLMRPILNVITLPIKLFALLPALLLANGVFLWFIVEIVQRMDPRLITMTLKEGPIGWLVIALTIGTANWLMKIILR